MTLPTLEETEGWERFLAENTTINGTCLTGFVAAARRAQILESLLRVALPHIPHCRPVIYGRMGPREKLHGPCAADCPRCATEKELAK